MNISALIERYNLKPQHAYLLELIPLIEMIWADGRNQSKEIAIIHEITEKHVCNLNDQADGLTVVSKQDAKEFLSRFLQTRPPAGLLKELRELTFDWLADKGKMKDKNDSIISYCLDIAAACATNDNFNERVVMQEKVLLKDLTKALNIIE